MKKIAAALALCAALTFGGTAAAEEYIMSPGDQLQIYVLGHEDLSSRRNSTDIPFVVRPDGRLDFPLVGEIDTTGLTVYEFTNLLTKSLSEYIIDPKVTVNIAKLVTTRVFVLGEVKKVGMYEPTKGHRVLDALGAAGGFTSKAAKKNIFLIRNGQEDNIEKLNFNNYLRKGDASQNVVLNEGDCLYLTANGKLNFFTEVLPAIYRITNSWYYVKRTKNL